MDLDATWYNETFLALNYLKKSKIKNLIWASWKKKIAIKNLAAYFVGCNELHVVTLQDEEIALNNCISNNQRKPKNLLVFRVESIDTGRHCKVRGSLGCCRLGPGYLGGIHAESAGRPWRPFRSAPYFPHIVRRQMKWFFTIPHRLKRILLWND